MIRQAIIRAFAINALFFTCALADPLKDGRIAIVDISDILIDEDGVLNTPVLDQLSQSNVLVIGRYFARCQQFSEDKKHSGKWLLWRKRLIDAVPGKPDAEAKAILERGFAIMSIYQYNNRENKFAGTLPLKQCTETKYGKELKAANSAQAREGILDAEAAIDQANAVQQPPHTVIYFGVDYGFKKDNTVERDGLLAYFREIKKQFDLAHFRIGAYADGDALAVLTGENPDHEALIEVAWIAPSASYSGSSDFHTKGKWDLFQSKESNEKLISNGGKCLPFSYDANIQNETVADKNLGFWNKNGLYQVPPERTKAIFDQRRFICDTRALSLPPSRGSCKAPPAPSSCDDKSKPCFIRTVRVKPGQEGQSEAEIDYHDYGFYRREKPRQSAPISALHLRANNLGKLTQVARLRISVMVSGGFTRW